MVVITVIMTTLRSVNDGLTSFLPFSFLLCRDAGQSVITDGSLRLSYRPARSSLSLQGARALLTSFHSINKARACARSFAHTFVGLSFVVRFRHLALWWAFFKTIVENEYNFLMVPINNQLLFANLKMIMYQSRV